MSEELNSNDREGLRDWLIEKGRPKVAKGMKYEGIRTLGRIDCNTGVLFNSRSDVEMMELAYSIGRPTRLRKIRLRVASIVRNIYIKVVKYVYE